MTPASLPGEGWRMTRLFLRLAPLLLVAAVLVGCTPDYYRLDPAPAEIPPNALRIGVTSTYPPIIFRLAGQVSGVEADLARLLATRLGRPAYFVEVSWDQQISYL